MKLITNLSELTVDAVEQFNKAVTNPMDSESLAKAGIEQSTGLVHYDLQAPAKQLFPVLTPLRNVIPRVPGNGGTATNWRRVTAINSAALRGAVPEGTRNGVVTTTADDKSASYKAIGLEDTITFEADLAAKGFEDLRATQAQRLLWATMIEEELFDLGGNLSVALGTPTAPTVTVVDGGGTIPDATYNVIVVALSLHGYLAASLSGGLPGSVSVTPADGGTAFTYGGGNSQKSSATSTGAISNGDDSAIRASTPVVAGAVAYAWFVGTSGSELLEAITLINSVELTSLAGTGQNASAITADNSKNLLGYDGLLYHAWTSGSNAYIANLATGTPGTGTGLTADGAGGITELDTMLQSFWDNYKLSPTVIYVSGQEAKNITKKVLGTTAVNYSFGMQPGSEFDAGALVTNYLNKFGMGSQKVPVKLHPHMPAGTLMAAAERLPYPITNVPNVFEMRLRRDYYNMAWPLRTRKYESGVYFDGVLAHYFPPSIGIITNIADA